LIWALCPDPDSLAHDLKINQFLKNKHVTIDASQITTVSFNTDDRYLAYDNDVCPKDRYFTQNENFASKDGTLRTRHRQTGKGARHSELEPQ
jgi:hypothetical protein